MLKKDFILTIAILFISSALLAQYRWDFGVNIGASNYLGEIGGEEETRRDFVFDMKLNRTQMVFGVFGRYKITPQLAVNTGINYGRVKGSDSNSKNPARVARNLSFQNDILEISTRLELTLLYDNDVGGRGYYNPDFRLYGFLGAGVIRHNPKATYNGTDQDLIGELLDLQPLETEGISYNLWQFSLPAGIGLYFTHKKVHRFGWEIGYRTTFTDYIDDVSTTYAYDMGDNSSIAAEMGNRTTEISLETAASYADEYDLETPNGGSYMVGEKRGDPTNNDGYLFTQFSYSYVIKGKSSFYRRRYTNRGGSKRIRRKSRAKF